MLIPIGSIFPALLAGNAVIFKPSEITPLTGEKIRELFIDAGVPEQMFQVVQGTGAVGTALVESSVEKIFFTGSTNVGKKVMQQAAASLKKVVLELGGHDAAVVCADADLENTSSGMVWGAFNNCGQNCNGVERIYLNEKIFDRFVEKMIGKTKQLRIGNGMDSQTDIGSLASEAQLKKMESIVENAKKHGWHVLVGGNRLENRTGYFFELTIILRDKKDNRTPDEEIFGPIVYVTPVKGEEAVWLANQSQFGLAASVWTGNAAWGKQIAQRLESGSVMINDVVSSFGIPPSDVSIVDP